MRIQIHHLPTHAAPPNIGVLAGHPLAGQQHIGIERIADKHLVFGQGNQARGFGIGGDANPWDARLQIAGLDIAVTEVFETRSGRVQRLGQLGRALVALARFDTHRPLDNLLHGGGQGGA